MTASETPPSKTKNRLIWWKTRRAKRSGAIALALCLVGIVTWWFLFRPYISTDDARVAATVVRVAPAGSGGQVVAILAAEGDSVKKGQVLVELDHAPAEARLQKAKATLDLAKREYRRAEQLGRQRTVPTREVDTARSASESAEAEFKLAQIALENTYLRSPTDGEVIQKATEVGAVLQSGQTAMTVADLNGAWVSANIEETEIGEIKIGQPASITIDEGGELEGEVSQIIAATAASFALIPIESSSGNFTKVVQRIPIKVRIENSGNRKLKVGQSVEIRVRVR